MVIDHVNVNNIFFICNMENIKCRLASNDLDCINGFVRFESWVSNVDASNAVTLITILKKDCSSFDSYNNFAQRLLSFKPFKNCVHRKRSATEIILVHIYVTFAQVLLQGHDKSWNIFIFLLTYII